MLDDDYELDRRTGEINLVKKTEDKHDVLYAQDKKGKINKKKFIVVKKGVLNNKKSGKTKNRNYNFYSVNKDNDANDLFEFVANNSAVEWSLIQFDTKSNYLSTTNKPHSDYSGPCLVFTLLKGKYTLRGMIHSHPTSTLGASGFNPNSTKKGDKNFADWLNNAGSKALLQVYEVKTNKYIKYNHIGIIK